jgi:hypothetical protein
MTYNILNDAKDDLNIVLYEILHNKRPQQHSLDQIEYMNERLEKEFEREDMDTYDEAEIAHTIELIEDVLRIYQTEKDVMSSVKIRECTKIRLNKVAATYDLAITKLLDEYEK